MALAVSKDGKIIDKHLKVNIATIKKIILQTDTKKHKKIIQRALKTKINKTIS